MEIWRMFLYGATIAVSFFLLDAFRRFGSERVSGVEHNLKETRAGGQATKSDGWRCGWLMGDEITNHQILICICLA